MKLPKLTDDTLQNEAEKNFFYVITDYQKNAAPDQQDLLAHWSDAAGAAATVIDTVDTVAGSATTPSNYFILGKDEDSGAFTISWVES